MHEPIGCRHIENARLRAGGVFLEGVSEETLCLTAEIGTMITLHLILVWIIILGFPWIAQPTIGPGDRKIKKFKSKNEYEDRKPETQTVVNEIDIAKEILTSDDIIKNFDQYNENAVDILDFKGPILGYVTPWNNHGYDIAKIFGSKFTMISPVWLQIKRAHDRGGYRIEGTHDVDKGWMSDVTKNNERNVRILPRVLFDGWVGRDYQFLFSDENEMKKLTHTLTKYLKSVGFGGCVLEVWSQIGNRRSSDLVHLLTHLAESLHNVKMTLVLVIPPPINGNYNPTGIFKQEDFIALKDVVDAFSMMTYDFSIGQNPGPNAPIGWMRRCVTYLEPDSSSPSRQKILLGLNFYGYRYHNRGAEAITGKRFIKLLQNHVNMEIFWDSTSEEHWFQYRDKEGSHVMYYPTKLSVTQRLALASELGTGVAIWEIGQGLDYFYELL